MDDDDLQYRADQARADMYYYELEEEVERLRAAITEAYAALRKVNYNEDVFDQVAPIETALGRIVDEK